MKSQGLRAIQPKSFVPKTTDSRHRLDDSPNLILDTPEPSGINQRWVGDITYVPLRGGVFCYLASLLDRYSRDIVGWELAETMTDALTLAALRMAIRERQPAALLVHDTDRGGQYASNRYRAVLQRAGMRQSMSRAGNVYDNAFMESCFGTLKTELEMTEYDNCQAARREIAEYIDYYRTDRKHSALGYLSPRQFERLATVRSQRVRLSVKSTAPQSPFPGWIHISKPELFPDVHAQLISKIQAALNVQLRPNYFARIQVREYLEETPSRLLDPIEKTYLTIKHRESKALIAVLEVMSPSNKVHNSEGRKSFMAKRREVLSSEVHWIEIDLLRGRSRSGPPRMQETDYPVLVARGDENALTKCWPILLQQTLPVIGVPLRDADSDVPLDLDAVFDAVYEGGAYDLAIDYAGPTDPPLKPSDTRWAKKLLRAAGLR